jgi:hypothetical protein
MWMLFTPSRCSVAGDVYVEAAASAVISHTILTSTYIIFSCHGNVTNITQTNCSIVTLGTAYWAIRLSNHVPFMGYLQLLFP